MKWWVEEQPTFTVLKVKLEEGESITAEPGAMMLMKGDVEIKTSTGGVIKGLLRALAGGESVFLNTYTCRSGSAELWLVPPVPGDIVYQELDGSTEWVIQDTSYLAHHGEVDVSVAWRGLKGLLAEGELVWLKLSGTGGAWLNAYGAIQKLELKEGETAIVDNFHFVAMPADTKYRVRKFGGWRSFLLGGEGIVMEVEGPATIYLQTRILPPLAELIAKYLPQR